MGATPTFSTVLETYSDKLSMNMKLHHLILLFLLVSSLPVRAEKSNILSDALSLFSSGDEQGEECDETTTAEQVAEALRAEICPNFLMSQSMSRDQKTMIFSDTSADKNCEFTSTDSSFNSSQAFETYLKNKEPFSEINTTPIADCISHPFTVGRGRNKRNKALPEDKHKLLITEYYLTQHRLLAGLKNTLHDITAIDQLMGNPILNGIQCSEFQSISNISDECSSLQQCSPPSVDLGQSAEETIKIIKAITAIDKQIDKLEGSWFSGATEKNKDKIQELRMTKASLQSLHPWVAGKIFQDGYKENSSKEEVIQLIKEQLSYTRTRLKKNIREMQRAVSCTRYNSSCRGLNFDKVMAKTPAIDTDNIFQRKKITSMNDEEVQSLSPEQKTSFTKDLMADNYFRNAQCRQDIRENVSEVRKELGFVALDVGLTIATVGLGSAAIAGRLAVRTAGNISKAQRLQNLGLMTMDITFSLPHINRAINECDEHMNQLEQTASEKTNNVCEKLPVRSRLTSDLKSCLLTSSLASLPLIVPALGVAGRAGYLAVRGRRGSPLHQKASLAGEINSGLVERGQLGEKILGRKLSQKEKEALERAHRIGMGEKGKDGALAHIGNYTVAQLREKARILKESGFSSVETRKLMEYGVVGEEYTAKEILEDMGLRFIDRKVQGDDLRGFLNRLKEGGAISEWSIPGLEQELLAIYKKTENYKHKRYIDFLFSDENFKRRWQSLYFALDDAPDEAWEEIKNLNFDWFKNDMQFLTYKESLDKLAEGLINKTIKLNNIGRYGGRLLEEEGLAERIANSPKFAYILSYHADKMTTEQVENLMKGVDSVLDADNRKLLGNREFYSETMRRLTKNLRGRDDVSPEMADMANSYYRGGFIRSPSHAPSKHHEVLEVPPGASLEKITKAYRRKAMEWHPDRRPDDPNATEKFRKIKEAYEALRDP